MSPCIRGGRGHPETSRCGPALSYKRTVTCKDASYGGSLPWRRVGRIFCFFLGLLAEQEKKTLWDIFIFLIKDLSQAVSCHFYRFDTFFVKWGLPDSDKPPIHRPPQPGKGCGDEALVPINMETRCFGGLPQSTLPMLRACGLVRFRRGRSLVPPLFLRPARLSAWIRI
ncbi:hypothetical protein AB205_0045370, partial [Aquarana catesbeiana]